MPSCWTGAAATRPCGPRSPGMSSWLPDGGREAPAGRVLAPDVLLAEGAELPPVLHRPVDIPRRDLDADDGAVLARADAHPLQHGPGLHRGPADPARAAVRPLRRCRRRPGGQAAANDRAADRHGF